MTPDEFRTELFRHLIAIIRACMLYYGWTMADLTPRMVRESIKRPVIIGDLALPVAAEPKR